MSKRGRFETRATAIHEAGHAVAAAIYGPAGWRVTIEEGERRDGGLDFSEPRWPERDEVEAWITRCLIGPSTRERLPPEPPWLLRRLV